MNTEDARFRRTVGEFVAGRLAPSERELDIARLAIIDGMTHGEIARARYISVGTVKAHLSHFSAKVGLPLRQCRRELPRLFWSAEPQSDEDTLQSHAEGG